MKAKDKAIEYLKENGTVYSKEEPNDGYCQLHNISKAIDIALKARDEEIEEAVTNYWQDGIIRILKELGIKK